MAALHSIGANDSPKRKEAENFLKDILSKEGLAAKQVRRLAGEAGINWRTVERAKKSLRIKTVRIGFGRDAHYEWELPKKEVTNSMGRHCPDGGGLCDEDAPDTPTDGAFPMDRQIAGHKGMAAHGNSAGQRGKQDEQKDETFPSSKEKQV